MRPLLNDKRGDIFQLPYLIILILVIASIGLLIGYLSWKITDAYKNMDQIQASETASKYNERLNELTPSVVDWMVFFFFLFGTVALMVAAVRTSFSIVIIGLFIFLFVIAIFIASGAVNIYQGFAQSDTLSIFSGKLTFTNILFSKYMPLIIVLIGAVILIIMYGKSGSNINF